MRIAPALLALFPLAIAACEAPRESSAAAVPVKATATAAPSEAPDLRTSPLGDGLVVWESSRTGAWRIFGRGLDGGDARQLSPDEPGRQHCCAHLAPDGRRLVYLALPDGQETYPPTGAEGKLELLTLEGAEVRQLAPAARTYFEHRAAVWRDDTHLIFIDGSGATRELSLADAKSRELVVGAGAPHGFLLDPGLRFATQGTPTFAPYDAAGRRVLERPTLGGCQPYFTADGRGYWVAGAGGPIRWIDLASRAVGEILRKGDSRLPADRRYLYFPMISRDQRLIAWGGSNDEHDHRRADYDIFVAPLDPKTLALAGGPRRVTDDPATDRFPDVHVEKLTVALDPSMASAAPPVAAGPAAAQPDEILAWRGGRHANLVRDASGQELSTLFERQGRAFWDDRFAADLRGGALLADLGTMERFLAGARATNELCLDLVLTPSGNDGVLLLFGDDKRQANLALALEGGELFFELLTASSKGVRPPPRLRFGKLIEGKTAHVAVCYRAGLLEAYLDGKPVAKDESWLEGFYDWQKMPLVIGRGWSGDRAFHGKVHRLVARNRFATATEVASWAAAAAELAPKPAAIRVRLELVQKSPTPSLAEIAPYREALAAFLYQVVAVERGELPGIAAGTRVRVVHPVIADGDELPIARLAPGRQLMLELRPFLDQPQLESLFLSNRLPAGEQPIYFSETIEP